MADVLVIGGGILGTGIAAMCARRGMTVTLCERHGLAAGASGRNGGLVAGPHPPELAEIARRSLREYGELHHATGGAFFFDRADVANLLVAETPEQLDGHPGELLDADALREAEPLLAHDLAGARRMPCRRIDPAAAVAAFADDARGYGAQILLGCEARALLVRGGDVCGALTDGGEIIASHTVVAAGPWSWRLLRRHGVDLPVRGVRGWMALTQPAPFRLAHVVGDIAWGGADGGGAVPPTLADLAEGVPSPVEVSFGVVQDADDRILIGSSLQHAAAERDESEETLRAIARRAIRMLPALAGLAITETRSCARPTTPHGLPLHGPVPGLEGVVVACGHGAQGVTWGPGAAAAVADGIATGEWAEVFLPEAAGVAR